MTSASSRSTRSHPESSFDSNWAPSGGKPLRVALVTDADIFAGTERHILDLALALRKVGVEAVIACPTDSAVARRASLLGMETITVPRHNFPLTMVPALAHGLRYGYLDVVHAHNGVSKVMCSAALALASRGSAVSTQHFVEPSRIRRAGLKAALSNSIHAWADRKIDEFIAISQTVKQGLIDRKEGRPEQITVVPNGIFLPSTLTRTREQVRRQLSVGADEPLVVSVARLDPEKNHEVLINAVSILCKRMPEVQCVIAGEGAEHDKLKALIDRLNLRQCISLIGYDNDPLSLMAASDVFVLPAACEPFGLVVLEAMSVARPVIAAAAGGPLEIIEDGSTGFLFEPGNSQQLAEIIEQLLSDTSQRTTIGATAHKAVAQRFNAEIMAQRIASIYRKAAAHDPAVR